MFALDTVDAEAPPTNGPAYDINVDKLFEYNEFPWFELNWDDESCKQSLLLPLLLLLDLHDELNDKEFDEDKDDDDEELDKYDGELEFVNDVLLLLLLLLLLVLLIFTTWAAAHHAAAACIGLACDLANFVLFLNKKNSKLTIKMTKLFTQPNMWCCTYKKI